MKIWLDALPALPSRKGLVPTMTQNCLFFNTFKTGNLNLLFYCHNCFLWILLRNRCSYFKKKCSSNLGVVYPDGFQGRYTGLGTRLCIKLMKNSSEKFILIQILRDKIFIAIVSKHFKKRNFMTCLFFKETIKTVFMSCFKPVYTSNFALGLECVLYIVVGFDAPLVWNYQPKEHSRVLKILSEWKYETFSWRASAHNPGFQAPNLLVF